MTVDDRAGTTSREPQRIVFVGTRELIASGFTQVLRGESAFSVAGVARSTEEAIDLVRAIQPHLVVVDNASRASDDIRLLDAVTAEAPQTNVVIMTDRADLSNSSVALKAGARAYLTLCGTNVHQLVTALRSVAAGLTVVGPTPQPDREPATDALPPEHREVLSRIATGMTTEKIAQDLDLSLAGVRSRIARIYRRLGVSNRSAAVAEAHRQGLLR
jgi:DNA-binding NarL/FixJ family response regulator